MPSNNPSPPEKIKQLAEECARERRPMCKYPTGPGSALIAEDISAFLAGARAMAELLAVREEGHREFWIDDLTLKHCGPWSEIAELGWPDCEKAIHAVEVSALAVATARFEAERERLTRYHHFIMGRAARQYGIDANMVKLWDDEWKSALAETEGA